MILEKCGDEMENVFEKRQFLRMTTYLVKKNVKKKTFFRVTTYFFKENVEKHQFSRMTTYFC